MNVMTIGFLAVSNRADMVEFVMLAYKCFGSDIKGSITKVDMFVGRPGAESPYLEDDDRTMIIPVNADSSVVYACVNETGGLTFMLAEEY